MAYMGANVLHEAAVFPVQEADIPIQNKNTNDPFRSRNKNIESQKWKGKWIDRNGWTQGFLSISFYSNVICPMKSGLSESNEHFC